MLEFEEGTNAAVGGIVAEAQRTATQDRAVAICLGCAGMAGLDEAVAAATGVPVVDGVEAAVKLAEALVGLQLATSRARTYAAPHSKRIAGWPLTS